MGDEKVSGWRAQVAEDAHLTELRRQIAELEPVTSPSVEVVATSHSVFARPEVEGGPVGWVKIFLMGDGTVRWRQP